MVARGERLGCGLRAGGVGDRGLEAGRIDEAAPAVQLLHGMHQHAAATQPLLQQHRMDAACQGGAHQHPVVVGEQQQAAVLRRLLPGRRHQIQPGSIGQLLALQQVERLPAFHEHRHRLRP
jgi:hypothetical protein